MSEKKEKMQESSGTRLDGAFVKVVCITCDVCIHTCSHGLFGYGYGFEGFHGCIAMMYFVE